MRLRSGPAPRARRTPRARLRVELVETGLEAKDSERERFLALARRFKESSSAAESDRLREELANMIFGE
jgi:hypothetical protein